MFYDSVKVTTDMVIFPPMKFEIKSTNVMLRDVILGGQGHLLRLDFWQDKKFQK